MGTEKRERQKAQRLARIEAEAAAAKKAARTKAIRNAVVAGVAIVAIMVLVTALSGCSSDKKDEGKSDPKIGSKSICPPTPAAKDPHIDFPGAAPTCIKKSKDYTATVRTNLGTVTFELDQKKAPKAVNNFVFLARWRYYDDTTIFRTETASGIIQGGSPHTQDNSDPGPGYTFPDEGLPFPKSAYGPGALAMANHGPDTNGAQFFMLANYGARYLGDPTLAGPNAGAYVVFGKATKGLDVLEKIAKLDDGTGVPARDVVIRTITIKES